MKIIVTNKLGLPEPYVRAVQNDPYDPDDGGQRSDYTITQLLKPARMAELSKTVAVQEDAIDRLVTLEGQLIHELLERGKAELEAEGYIIEKRFYKSYVVNDKIFVVSAKVDVYDPVNARVSDYKYTSVGSALRGTKDEHRAQVNFQAELLRKAGFPVEQADVTLLLRDWSKEQAVVRSTYPQSPGMVQQIPLWAPKEVDEFIVSRIQAHEAAKLSLPRCSDDERWSRKTFAVMKTPFDKKAIRVLDTLQQAQDYIAAKDPSIPPSLVIVERPGQPIRCMRYCPVRSVCEQAKEGQAAPVVDEDGFIKVS